jgi:DNA-binding NarL/FixJ family response regulator
MADDFTDGERRVAELVARGLTNREIGDALGLRSKTVEWRLTAIYRKLGLRSRTELALHVVAGHRAVKAGELPGRDSRG